MSDFSNSQKLAAVVSEWARPAITQIASSKLCGLPFMQTLQNGIINLGLVSSQYRINSDIEPMLKPIADALLQPMLEQYFANIPESAIPQMARNIVSEMMKNETYSILDGLIVFDKQDILELKNLVEKNLQIEDVEKYKVIN